MCPSLHLACDYDLMYKGSNRIELHGRLLYLTPLRDLEPADCTFLLSVPLSHFTSSNITSIRNNVAIVMKSRRYATSRQESYVHCAAAKANCDRKLQG
jgi:hypothetical protein